MNGLALGGGGANGAFQAGKIIHLRDNMTWDAVSGISVGAINGAAVATSQFELLENMWMNMDNSLVFRERSNLRIGWRHLKHKVGVRSPLSGKYNFEPLRELLVKHFFGKVTTCDLIVICVKVTEGRPNGVYQHWIRSNNIITIRDIDFILASAAIPVVFDGVKIKDDIYFDGGVSIQSPINPLIETFPIEYMDAIACQPFEPSPVSIPKSIVETATWALEELLTSGFRRDWEDFIKWNYAMREITRGGGDLIIQGKKVRYIWGNLYFPPYHLGNSISFDGHRARRNFLLGKQYSKPLTQENGNL